MANKMMITGKVVKKPEHIELGKYNITVQTAGGREITVMVDSEGINERIEVGMLVSFLAVKDGDVVAADSVSYKKQYSYLEVTAVDNTVVSYYELEIIKKSYIIVIWIKVVENKAILELSRNNLRA